MEWIIGTVAAASVHTPPPSQGGGWEGGGPRSRSPPFGLAPALDLHDRTRTGEADDGPADGGAMPEAHLAAGREGAYPLDVWPMSARHPTWRPPSRPPPWQGGGVQMALDILVGKIEETPHPIGCFSWISRKSEVDSYLAEP